MTGAPDDASYSGDVLLVQAHTWSEATSQRICRIFRELAGFIPCRLLLQDDGGPVRTAWQDTMRIEAPSAELVLFHPLDLLQRYVVGPERPVCLVPGYTHLPVVDFSKSERFARYWLIESDVEYTGCWRDLLQAFCDDSADLLASHVYSRAERPDWYWWASLRDPSGRLPADSLKAFFPVYRITADALRAVQEGYDAGWRGHYECLLPSLITKAGMVVRDLRSGCPCYDGDSQDPGAPLGRLSTMRWRPFVGRAELVSRCDGPKLFHPVKGELRYAPE